MKKPKDNFSNQSSLYAKYRPTYPPELYPFLLSLVNHRQAAWDCATGNGQVAAQLSQYFEKVYATDISQQQINNAVEKENIFYSIERAETTSFKDDSFDLITVGQAIHWFDFESFYQEVHRTGRNNCIIALIGYGLPVVDLTTDTILQNFYHNVVGQYWDKERIYIEEKYLTIPFPFKEINAPAMSGNYEWTLNEFAGYIESWSAVQHYIKANNENPMPLIKNELQKNWPGNSTKTIHFHTLLRVGKI